MRPIYKVALSMFVLFCVYAVGGTSLSQRLGNLFFGDVPQIYNVHLAQLFFIHAASPIFGNPEPYANYQLSRTHFIKGDFDEALRLADEELKYYSEHFHTYYIKGLTLGYMHREHEAIESFARFLEHKPESWAARNDKAWLHFRIGEVDAGMETIIPAAQAHPENPWVMNTFGVLLMNQGLLDEAERALTQAALNAEALTPEEWGKAYPGNSPSIYGMGVEAMRASIASNLEKIARERTLRDDDN